MNKTSDGKRTYTINVVFGTAQSSDAGVASVKVADVEAAAGKNNAYTVTVPYGTAITADSFVIALSDNKAGVTAGPTEGESGVWSFTVTAEDGTAVTYTVTVTVAEAPKSSDAGVTSVSVAHTLASKTGETAYTVKLQTNAEVTADSFQIVLSDEKASVSAPTANGDVWTFTVTAEDGTTTAAYTVTVTRRSASETTPLRTVTLSMLKASLEDTTTRSFTLHQTAGSNVLTSPYRIVSGASGIQFQVKVSYNTAYSAVYAFTTTDGTAKAVDAPHAKNVAIINPDLSGSLVAVITLTNKTDASDVWVYELRMPTEANHAPRLKDGVITPAAASINLGESYQFDMTQIFEDEDAYDKLTYRVWRDAENPFYVPASYTYTPSAAGTYTLVFKASDGKAESPEYKFVLTVIDPNAKSSDAGVASVKVAGVEAAAGTAENSYSVTLPAGTEVTADSFEITLSDSKATLTGPAKGEDGVWTFTVTAEDGVTSKTYTVTVSFTEAPKSNDAGVSSVTVAGFKAVAGANNSYTVTVPYGTVVKTGSFVIVTRHPRAAVSALTNTRNIWSFTVTAEDGVTTAVYTVTVNTAALPEPITPGVDNKKPASKPEVKLPFTDVSTSDWFYDDVAFVYKNGLFSGTDSRSFSPNASMTRAMLVTVLYRLEGEPTVTGRSSFTDVRSGAYYEKSVIWAAANGIVTGTDSTSFSPDAKVTREQLAAILYRYAQYRKLDTDASAKLNSFTDADSVSAYASEALGWAVSEGLINGASGKLMPKGDATRAQVAAILHRLVKNVLN